MRKIAMGTVLCVTLLGTAALADMDPKTGAPYELFEQDAPGVDTTPADTMPPNNCLAKLSYIGCMLCAGRLENDGYLDAYQADVLRQRCYEKSVGIIRCSVEQAPVEPAA